MHLKQSIIIWKKYIDDITSLKYFCGSSMEHTISSKIIGMPHLIINALKVSLLFIRKLELKSEFRKNIFCIDFQIFFPKNKNKFQKTMINI